MLQLTSSIIPQHPVPVVVTLSQGSAAPSMSASSYTPPFFTTRVCKFQVRCNIRVNVVVVTCVKRYSTPASVTCVPQLVFAPSGAAWEATMGALLSQLTRAVQTRRDAPVAGAGLHAPYLAALKLPASSVCGWRCELRGHRSG